MPGGIALERTFKEWQTTIFAQHDPSRDLPLTCSGCHMKSDPSTAAIATAPNARSRPSAFHEHLMAGIDEAADRRQQRTGMQPAGRRGRKAAGIGLQR